MPRLRTRSGNFATVTVTHGSPPIIDAQTTLPRYWESCSDTLGYPDDHPLTLIKEEIISGGEIKDFFQSLARFANGKAGLPSNNFIQPYVNTVNNFISTLTLLRVVAATGPLTPSVYNLTNLLEIRDIPRMIKHAGNLLHGIRDFRRLDPLVAGPGSVLAYQFGWKPLFDDLLKITDFGRLVAIRQRQLTDLNNGKMVRRTVQLGSVTGSFSETKNIANYIGNWPVHSTMVCKAWATIHWRLVPGQSAMQPPTWWDAFNILYGIPRGEIPIQVWKALPWTWLTDWFVNVSQNLEVIKNLLTYSPSRLNLMWTTTVDEEWLGGSGTAGGKQWTFNTVHARRTVKNRSQLSGAGLSPIRLQLPFLDSYKLSVLGSLTTLRIAKSFKR